MLYVLLSVLIQLNKRVLMDIKYLVTHFPLVVTFWVSLTWKRRNYLMMLSPIEVKTKHTY